MANKKHIPSYPGMSVNENVEVTVTPVGYAPTGKSSASTIGDATMSYTERPSKWFWSDKITGEDRNSKVFITSGIKYALVNDYNLNPSTGLVYQCTMEGSPHNARWRYIGSLRGPQGEVGPRGPVGRRGSMWYVGNVITGESNVPTAYPTGLTSALPNDLYLNNETQYIYLCVEGGDDTTATWVYATRLSLADYATEEDIDAIKGFE